MTKKILVVEDEVITAMGMTDMLELWGYEPLEPAATASEALERVAAQKPDLVILDIRIQGEADGIETAKKIRQMIQVPVVFVTGYTDSEIRKRAEAASPAGYLVKPIDLDRLKSVLSSILG
ncbi:MAG: response regulator [Nitrospiraceae bacterium]|nr:response regulator [Nitrospiraceae bacterium]